MHLNVCAFIQKRYSLNAILERMKFVSNLQTSNEILLKEDKIIDRQNLQKVPESHLPITLVYINNACTMVFSI